VSDVFTTTYELSGDARAKAEAHYAEVDAAHDAWRAAFAALGANACRANPNGAVVSLSFPGGEAPAGYRIVDRHPDGSIECVPHKGTRVGKAVAETLAALPTAPRNADLLVALSANLHAIDHRAFYSGTSTRLKRPAPRYFVRLPRTADDDWTPGDGLTAIPESEFMAAVEAHNAAVRATDEARSAA
jgi:hypothetical protein